MFFFFFQPSASEKHLYIFLFLFNFNPFMISSSEPLKSNGMKTSAKLYGMMNVENLNILGMELINRYRIINKSSV
nr:replication association protein [Okra leaf curl Mali virus satellite DNA beta]